MILLLLVGGIFLYKTYALYEEKKEFNVLRGRIPNFVKIKTIAEVNGKISASIPTKEELYEITNVTCDKGSTGKWDEENWQVVVEKPTNKEITCTVTFLTSEFKKLAQLIGSNAKNMNELLENSSDVDKIVASEEAMKLIVNSKKLPNDIKKSENYTIEVRKKFLSSNVVSESTKYNVGLPFYVFKFPGENLTGEFTSVITWGTGYHGSTIFSKEENYYNIYASYTLNSITSSTNNEINTSGYSKLEINYKHYTNTGALTGTMFLGLGKDLTADFSVSNSEKFNSTEKTSILTTDISKYQGNYHLKVKMMHNGETPAHTAWGNIYSMALY